jgi:hypothetical protein
MVKSLLLLQAVVCGTNSLQRRSQPGNALAKTLSTVTVMRKLHNVTSPSAGFFSILVLFVSKMER